MYRKFIKRLFDIVGSVTGLIITMPVLLFVSVILIFINRGSPFFYQSRPGRNGKIFRIVKFKTMNDKRDKSGKLLPNSERLHKTGRFIRSISVDELPQMINVLRGDMSFVGPRPLLVEYLPLYSARQASRHNVRPGITGLAQVNGRNSISWEQKLEYDACYVDNLSPALDIKIIFLTIVRVFTRQGVNANENTTMVSFSEYCRQSDRAVNRYII